jgi:hypothetical protein
MHRATHGLRWHREIGIHRHGEREHLVITEFDQFEALQRATEFGRAPPPNQRSALLG